MNSVIGKEHHQHTSRVVTADVKSPGREAHESEEEKDIETRKLYARTRTNLFPVRLRLVRRCSRSCAQFSAEMQLQYRFAPASRPRSKRARVFIDDTFRPEQFQLSLFWQVSLRLASSHSSLSPDHQSG